MLRPRGEGSLRRAGGGRLLGEVAYKLHGRRGQRRRTERHRRRRGRGLRRKPQGRGEDGGLRGRRRLEGSGNPCIKTPPARVAGLPAPADVYLHGAYHVGLAAAALSGRQPCGDGACPDAACHHRYGHQPEILCERLQGPCAPRAQYGHPRGPRLRRVLCLQHLRAFPHDGGAARGRLGRRHGLDARVLF